MNNVSTSDKVGWALCNLFCQITSITPGSKYQVSSVAKKEPPPPQKNTIPFLQSILFILPCHPDLSSHGVLFMYAGYSRGSISVQDLSGFIKINGYRPKCMLHPSRSHSRPKRLAVGLTFTIFIIKLFFLFIINSEKKKPSNQGGTSHSLSYLSFIHYAHLDWEE